MFFVRIIDKCYYYILFHTLDFIILKSKLNRFNITRGIPPYHVNGLLLIEEVTSPLPSQTER